MSTRPNTNPGSSTVRRSAKPQSIDVEARPGDVVTIHYTSQNRDGGVFETSQNRRPLQFVAGKSPVIAGVGDAILGMRPGDRRTIAIPAEQAFGQRDPSLEQAVPRSALPEHLEEGDQLRVIVGEREIDVWVRSVDAETAILDANHPLAGEPLVVDIELITVERPAR